MLFSRRRGALEPDSSLFGAALLAAHGVKASEGGFAATDVRFFYRLFSNFLERDLTRPGHDLALTQVQRALTHLGTSGLASARGRARLARGKPGARHALTARGVLRLLELVMVEAPRRSFDEAVFAAVFAASYRSFILAHLPPASARAGAELCDVDRVLARADAQVARVEADLRGRATSGLAMAEEARTSLAATRDPSKTARRLDRPGAYQLQGVRSLGELVGALPGDLGAFEMEHGILLRARALFGTLADRATAERRVLRALARRLTDRSRE